MSFRIGIGYDIHRLMKGRKLFLGGVEIPFGKGLKGHSDADVVLHAVCDALLGAAGLGDIGEHFPNTDKKYKGISSLVLLGEVNRLIQKNGFQIGNIDCVVIAEEPDLKLFKPKIKAKISQTLGIPAEAVNIKATTREGIGFGDTKEAIGAYAVAIIK